MEDCFRQKIQPWQRLQGEREEYVWKLKEIQYGGSLDQEAVSGKGLGEWKILAQSPAEP